MAEQFVIVPADDLRLLREEVAALAKALAGATVIPAPQWVTPAEAARRLNVNSSTVQRRIAAGSMEAKTINGKRMVKINPAA